MIRACRSVLYVPASNERALAKIGSLECDAVVLDLEDAVVPEAKAAARDRVVTILKARGRGGPEMAVRINALSTEFGADDLAAVGAAGPDAILLPKVAHAREILEAGDALDEIDAPDTVRLWAMIETARALMNLGPIAELGRDSAARLSGLLVGINDIQTETGVTDRRYLAPWLVQVVLAARAGGLFVLDAVSNDFSDLDAFARDCAEGAAMGFDGKTLIHPAQIAPANAAFSPGTAALDEARRIVEAFARPENAGRGAIALDGRMVERLHLAAAERLIARARAVRGRAG